MIKIVFALMMALGAQALIADVAVGGYTRKDGTYVPPHYRSNPDGFKGNNWGSQGNYNPYTGKSGNRSW